MAKGGKTIAGMDYQFAEHIKTLQQYGDQLTILPDKHRVMMKFLGPLYDTYIKLGFSLESVKSKFISSGDAGVQSMEHLDKKSGAADKTLNTFVKTVGVFGAVLTPVVATAGMFKKLLTGIVGTVLTMVGLIFSFSAVLMILVASLDQGGGKLRAWLEDLPVVGDAFGFVQSAVDKVKGALDKIPFDKIKGGLGSIGTKASETFGPVFSAATTGMGDLFDNQTGRMSGLWETLKANVVLPEIDSESFFGGITDGMTAVVELFFTYYNMIYEMIFGLITAIVEAGIVQAIVDAVMSIWDGVVAVFDNITGAFDDMGVTFDDIVNEIMEWWNILLDFLVSSGIFEFLGELIAWAGEFIGVILHVAGFIIGIVIKIIGWIYPYIKPYWMYLLNALGFILTPILLIVRTVIRVSRIVMALLTGNTEKAKELWNGIVGMWGKGWDRMKGFAAKAVNALIDFTSPLWKGINAGIKLANKIPGVNIPTINYKSWKFKKGGIASGPQSGYPVELHGTEAIVPLPDGRSIPVVMKGMAGGGGGDTNINITVNGANGDGRKLARQISEEVARVMRTRSRGGSYTRGV